MSWRIIPLPTASQMCRWLSQRVYMCYLVLPVQALLHVDEHNAWLQAAASPDSCTNLALDPGCRSADVAAEMVQLLLFSTNDYLGMSAHPAVKAAAAEAAAQVGKRPVALHSQALSTARTRK